VNKKTNNQRSAGHDADAQQYANIPAVQSAQSTDQQVCTGIGHKNGPFLPRCME